jgi:hypothetical protein
MADFAVLVSIGTQNFDFDRVKFDSGREMELKKSLRSFSICV